ncbi:MAG TPA: hypothetical protein VEY69_13840 [Lautropia sp.]|nr:hypothetical protein [Lautropia sp.]
MSGLRPFFLPLLALAIAFALRLYVIEPSHIGHACDPGPWSGWCAARTALIMTFRFQEIGWAALAAGIAATLLRRAWLGQLALALGFLGLVLYSYEPAAIGALLGALVLFRPRRGPPLPPGPPSVASASSETR